MISTFTLKTPSLRIGAGHDVVVAGNSVVTSES
jgi:hypothetical protein